jgi:putative membrane protein
VGWISVLPTVNVILNASSGVLLLAGFFFIKRRNVAAHRACMLSAFALSLLFLVSYVTYHSQAGSTRFGGQGIVRPIYFAILISHIFLAAVVLPLAIVTLRRALGGRFEDHRRIARKTFPIWLYVSVTGVLIYVLLYLVYEPAGIVP